MSKHLLNFTQLICTLFPIWDFSLFIFRQRMLPLLPYFSVTVFWCQCCSNTSPGSMFSLIQWLTDSHADPPAAYTYVTLNSGSYKENRIALPVTQTACLVLIKCRISKAAAQNNVRKININEVTWWMALRSICGVGYCRTIWVKVEFSK